MTAEKGILQRIRQLRIKPERPDENTIHLGEVPVHQRYFNKARSNVLLKREGQGRPFQVFVDEDLAYNGADPVMVKVFAGTLSIRGWHCLDLALNAEATMEEAVEAVFDFLGAEGNDPKLDGVWNTTRPEETGLLGTWARELTQDVAQDTGTGTLEREEFITQGAACFLREDEKRLLLIAGPPGVGKTNLIHGVTRRLANGRPDWSVSVMDVALVFSGTFPGIECDRLLGAILDELIESPDRILFIEHFDLVLRETAHGGLMVAHALDAGAKIGGTLTPAADIPDLPGPLARRTRMLELEEPDFETAVHIVQGHIERVARQYNIQIDVNMAGASVNAALNLPGCLPAKALSVLHAAAARAVLAGVSVVGLDDIYSAAAHDAGYAGTLESD